MLNSPPHSSPNSVIAAWIDCPAGLQAPRRLVQQLLGDDHQRKEDLDEVACRVDRQDLQPPPPGSHPPSPPDHSRQLQDIAPDVIAPAAPPDPSPQTLAPPSQPLPTTPPPPEPNAKISVGPEELLFSHYLQLIRQDLIKSSVMDGPPGWAPKGMSAAFATMCPTLEPLDFYSIFKSFSSALPQLAKLNWLLMAPFLWSVRFVLLQTNIIVALLYAVLGLSLMVAADQAAAAQLKQEQQRGSSSIIVSSRKHALQFFEAAAPAAAVPAAAPPAAPPAAAAAAPAPAGPSHAPARAAPEAATVAQASRGMPTSSRPKEDPALQQVRSAIIKLETALYGNELSDGLLPVDQLSVFTQKLCEEVGMTFKAGGSVAEMQQALKEVQKIVGV